MVLYFFFLCFHFSSRFLLFFSTSKIILPSSLLQKSFCPLPQTHFPARRLGRGDPYLNTNRKELKWRSERPLPLVFSVSFVVIFGGVVVFGHRESVGKLKKNKDFFSFFFFTMKPSRLKIMEKVFIFLWFNLL
ncbi:unnamed protein product, partial [Vitis vinifera]